MQFEAWPAHNPEFVSDTSITDGGINIPNTSGSSVFSSQDSILSSSADSLGDPSPSPSKRVLRRGAARRKQRQVQAQHVEIDSAAPEQSIRLTPTSSTEDPASPMDTSESPHYGGISPMDFEFSSIADRCDGFVENSRVYHALFGTGVVCANDGTYLAIRFDDSRYGMMKLKATFAVPKMILMPNF
eukprot:TRINITY_DN6396_c0_g2_i1.p1 TRINITY_DN6396_c0_g2~~TRINITY_DN6396_c0_g2_i1.p1  ORF type:complete len:186 (-),score=24.04 TRINITY_DN6396_c0_g2_i1:232-789(-)